MTRHLLVFVAVSTACAPLGTPGPSPATITVEVVNEGWEDAALYIVRDGLRLSVGFVRSLETRAFAVPAWWLTTGAEVRLLAVARLAAVSRVSAPIESHSTGFVRWLLGTSEAASAVLVR